MRAKTTVNDFQININQKNMFTPVEDLDYYDQSRWKFNEKGTGLKIYNLIKDKDWSDPKQVSDENIDYIKRCLGVEGESMHPYSVDEVAIILAVRISSGYHVGMTKLYTIIVELDEFQWCIPNG
jgi:hypothetical protein